MSLSAEKLVAVLERRYDYHSARVMFRQVAARAGLSEGGPFGAPELERFAAALDQVGDRLGDLLDAIRAGGKGAAAPVKPAPAPEAPAPAPEPAVAKAPAAEPVAEAAADAASDAASDAPAGKSDGKSDGRDDRQHGNHQGKKKG